MQEIGYKPPPTWRYVTTRGAAVGVGLTFAYAGVFIVYAMIRTSLTLVTTGDFDAGLPGTLVATWASLAIASLTIASLMAVIAAIVGLITAVIMRWLLTALNPRRAPLRSIIIGLVTCLGIVLLFNIFIQRALGFSWSALVPEAYLFWLGLPGLIYVGAGGVASWRLNLQQQPLVRETV